MSDQHPFSRPDGAGAGDEGEAAESALDAGPSASAADESPGLSPNETWAVAPGAHAEAGGWEPIEHDPEADPAAAEQALEAGENGFESDAGGAAPADVARTGEADALSLPVADDANDPFGAWPEPAVETADDEPESIEHEGGEIDVPDQYTVLEGTPTGHRRSVAVVVSRFNGSLTNRMLARAIEALEEAGVATDAVTVVPVPGAFELPLAAMALAKTRRYACVVALGAIVRGETPHFDYIASEAASGLQLAAIETGIPVAFGVLTVETVAQAEARIDRAAVAVRTALEMADLFARLRASARAG